MDNLIPLNLLARGELGRIDQLIGAVDAVHRMEEIGVHRGARVEMVQPGTPCIVQLNGHRVCFRDNDSLTVLVKTEVSL